MKVLIVDDEIIVLESCRRVLEEDGFEVSTVSSAYEALKKVDNEDFHLILIDVKMPEHDGMYLMREVKEKIPDMPIIIMSGYHTKETIEEAVQTGAATFIAKPFTPDELLETVRQVIQREKNYEKNEGTGN